ncbi:hypothetical protein [Chryseobacterium sp. SL1]|uniref:hypothetical protein n=1 Tax=Chryseobacterium sp. SL1 TaxID=2995159 RepID=UPI002276523E|nr:hypothetical protein [Chryseobacterium sp. SL1]MCY1660392.1 hypothetical protein [Chryseobacterium sp. SL1]
MNNLKKLGKVSETIGKSIFCLLVFIIVIIAFVTQLEKNINISLSERAGVIIGTIVAIFLFYFILRALFRPIYNLNNEIQLRLTNQLTGQEYTSKWIMSLICTVIISLLLIIPSFGISFLLMLPQFILLYKSKEI